MCSPMLKTELSRIKKLLLKSNFQENETLSFTYFKIFFLINCAKSAFKIEWNTIKLLILKLAFRSTIQTRRTFRTNKYPALNFITIQ